VREITPVTLSSPSTLVLIFGGGVTMFLGETTPVLLIVIGLKIYFDVKAHLKERKRS
jgi:hypothetical protein